MTAAAKIARARLLTVAELAERLRISKRSAYRVAREMMNVTIAGRLLVPEPAVDRYVESKMQEPTWDASTNAVTRTTPTTSIVPANDGASRRAPEISRSLAPASETSSWLRPIAPRTRPKPSTKR